MTKSAKMGPLWPIRKISAPPRTKIKIRKHFTFRELCGSCKRGPIESRIISEPAGIGFDENNWIRWEEMPIPRANSNKPQATKRTKHNVLDALVREMCPFIKVKTIKGIFCC